MSVTIKRIISLLLMTASLAVVLALLPEHPTSPTQQEATTELASQATK